MWRGDLTRQKAMLVRDIVKDGWKFRLEAGMYLRPAAVSCRVSSGEELQNREGGMKMNSSRD